MSTAADSSTPVTGPYCDRCGEPAGSGAHADCQLGRELEPPRFCPTCRRRMKVQVLPRGWVAHCVEHGATEASTSRGA